MVEVTEAPSPGVTVRPSLMETNSLLEVDVRPSKAGDLVAAQTDGRSEPDHQGDLRILFLEDLKVSLDGFHRRRAWRLHFRCWAVCKFGRVGGDKTSLVSP